MKHCMLYSVVFSELLLDLGDFIQMYTDFRHCHSPKSSLDPFYLKIYLKVSLLPSSLVFNNAFSREGSLCLVVLHRSSMNTHTHTPTIHTGYTYNAHSHTSVSWISEKLIAACFFRFTLLSLHQFTNHISSFEAPAVDRLTKRYSTTKRRKRRTANPHI